MKITVCQLPDDPNDLEESWNRLAEHVQNVNSELVLLPEMPIYPWVAQSLWDSYTDYKEKMFEVTDTAHAPWIIIDANRKTTARLEVAGHILDSIPYQ